MPSQLNEIALSSREMTRISPEEQDAILEKKIEDRFANLLLSGSDEPNHELNRQIMIDLCKGDLKAAQTYKPGEPNEAKYATGFIFWADNFAWIQNPRADEVEKKNIPFLLWRYQEEAAEEIIKAIVEGYDLPIEKSRDLGLSWLIIAIFIWGWHFHGWDLLVGSQKAENVDKRGNIKTLFGKARYLIERSPRWIIPELREKKEDKEMLLIHPTNSATFAGESNNPNFGRSDRRKAILFDEFASWELTDKAAWQSCASTTNCRIPLSTANTRGTNCNFFVVINNAKKKFLKYLRIHWSIHPVFSRELGADELGRPTSPWYRAELKRAANVAEAHQELDIDYDASMGDKVFPSFSLETNVSENVEYNPDLPLYISADFGLDSTAFLWWQEDREKGMLYVIDEYQSDGSADGTSIYHYIEILQSKEYKSGIMYGDPFSGENNSLTSGQSNAKILRRYGFVFKSQRAKIIARIAAARNLMERVVISDKCILLIESLSSWQFVKPKSGNTSSQTPKHDEYSHIGDAFTYFCYNHSQKSRQVSAPRKKFTAGASGLVA